VDPDISDSGRLTYAIIGGNQHQIFSMDESNGIITLVNLHTFDQATSYLLNVSVSDGVYATNTKVRINLRSANRHSPEFARTVFEMKFKENLPEGSRIGQVMATDLDRDLVKYSLLSQELGQLFRLDPYTGELWSLASLDREQRDSYELPIMAADQAGRSGFTTVKLSILDENDNAPTFPLAEYKANIPANLTSGFAVVRLVGQDRDAGRNAALTYSIYETQNSGVDDTFAVDVITGQIMLKRSALELENSVYQFFVRAQDGGRAPLHEDIPVEIYVMSPLDEAPRFEEHDTTYFLEEGSPVGRTVAELSAFAPPEGKVRYRIASKEYAGPESLFQIDEDTGRLMVAKLLDREERAVHRVTVLAETDSSPTLNTYTELIIQVLDENDHSPQFALLPAYEIAVSEAVAAHTPLLQALATDQDFGNNGEVTYSFSEESSGQLAHLFSIDPHNGWITSQGLLDYETTPTYILTVVATDNGKDRRSTQTTVKVTLVDANDNPPVFSQRLYTAAVNEGALPGTIIFQLQTTDADTAVESHVEFAITGGDPLGQFQIKQNGEVYVARSLDREVRSQYRMEVSATDGVFVNTCRVTIEILDDNDSPPVCSHYSYRHEVSESVAPGTALVTVTATDADEGRNARQVFSVTGDTADLFSIDRDLGVLSTGLPLDREKQDRHFLRVLVQDADMLEWSCESRVEIVLTDANDNKPEWDEAAFEAALPEDSAIGTIVTKVHATDRDLRENRRISYSLLDSAEGQFEVDGRTGLVSLARALDREERDSYNLTVRAIDSGRPRGTAVVTLLIRVLGK
jgi:protocadherin Fat 1/2/3